VDRVIEVKVSRTTCLECGGELVDHTSHVQYQVEIPPVQPIVTPFKIEVARCARCGGRAQARHPEQTSDARGAAAVQLGPRALGLATEMKHALGVPYRKVALILAQGLGLTVSPGALARADQRLAAKAEPTYHHLLLAVRQSRVVQGDETGWKVAGDNAWLWVFTAEGVTLYTIDRRRSHEVAERILGSDFQGVLECDCFLAYDPLPYRQQKCLGHLLRRCSELHQDPQPAEAIRLSRRLAALLRAAIRVHERQEQLGAEKYARASARLEAALDRRLAQEPTDEAAARLVKLLRKHRSQLFTFRYVAGVAPTNNAAERALRPAVVVRKISAGNRSPQGAQVHAVVTSLWQTCREQGRDFLNLVATLLRNPKPEPVLLVSARTASGEPP
jgi:transposase